MATRLISAEREIIAVSLRANGLTYQEIAAKMGTSPKTVFWWLKRAARRLAAIEVTKEDQDHV